MQIFKIENKDIIDNDNAVLGMATMVGIRVLPDEAAYDKIQDKHFAPGYYQFETSQGQISATHGCGNLSVDITTWDSNRDGVYDAILTIIEAVKIT